MTSRRVVILLIVALAVLAGAALISWHQRPVSIATKDEPLLKDLKPALNDVTELRIAKADGNHTTLQKHGAEWTVYERNYAADGSKVRKLLLDLSTLKAVEEKTSNPQLYPTIHVEDVKAVSPDSVPPPRPPKANSYDLTEPLSATRLDLVTPQKTWSVIVGKSGGYKEGYVRIVGAQQSYLANPRIDADVDPKRWLQQTIVDIPEARIQSVAVKPAKGPAYTVSREKKEDENFKVSNIPAKRKLSYESSGNALARGLESLSLDDVHPKPDTAPPAAPNTTVELSHATYKTFDGVIVEVDGRKESTPGAKKDDPKVEKFFITLAAASGQKATQPEAESLQKRVAGKELEISSYKYEGMFKPIEELLEALPEKKNKGGKKKD